MQGGSCSACPSGSFKAEVGDAACILCPKNTYSSVTGSTVCQQCGADHASPAGSSAASACQLPSPSSGGLRVEFQVVLPYSLEEFTVEVQDDFKIAIAATASTVCECGIAKTEVDIKRTTENAAPAGTHRRLHAANITVDVSILVPDAKTGRLLVDALSRESMNDELVKRGLRPITQVTSSPVLVQHEDASVLLRTTSLPVAVIYALLSVALVVLLVLVLCAVYRRTVSKTPQVVPAPSMDSDNAISSRTWEGVMALGSMTSTGRGATGHDLEAPADDMERVRTESARKLMEKEKERVRKQTEEAAQKTAAEEEMRKADELEAGARALIRSARQMLRHPV